MTGTLALQGGGPFAANDDLDRRLISAAGATRVVVLPTADAFEHPERLVAAAMHWGERLDVLVEALMVMRRSEAMDESAVSVVKGARAVYLVGDQPLHLRSVLKATPLWDAIAQVRHGGVVAATAGVPTRCDPMVDPRAGRSHWPRLGQRAGARHGGGDMVGRAPAPHVEVGQHAGRGATQRRALVHSPSGWEQIGEVVL
jgi:cyanophycinase-like exopeptidase